MNVDLPNLLTSRAHTVDPPRIDPFDVIAQGERLMRRRRRLAAAGTALAVTVSIGATALVLDVREDRPPAQPANPDGTSQHGSRPLSYGQGQILHLGDHVLDTELNFLTLDITDDGAAFTTLDGAIWFTDGAEIEQVGATLGVHVGPTGRNGSTASLPEVWVVNDSSGSLLAWLEYPDGEPELVVYDSGRRAVVARQPFELDGMQDTPGVVAVADREVFVTEDDRSTDDLWRYDVDSGVFEPVDVDVFEAAARGVPRGLVSGSSAEEGHVLGLGGAFYTPAHHFEALEVAASQLKGLFDPLTGQPLHVRVPDGYQTSPLYFVQWLDDDRFTLISGGGPPGDWPTGDLLVCRIASGRCGVAIEASTWNRRPLYPLLPGGGGIGHELALRQAMSDASESDASE